MMVESIIAEDDPFYEKLRQGFSTATTTTTTTSKFGVTELQVRYVLCILECDLNFSIKLFHEFMRALVYKQKFHYGNVCLPLWTFFYIFLLTPLK